QDWVEQTASWLRYIQRDNEAEEFFSRSGIVHRLDKETSGVLLIAKHPAFFLAMKHQFMERTVQKTYVAIIHNHMPSMEGEINAPIDRLPWNKELFGVVPGGKEAVTFYKVLQTFPKHQFIACHPKTGRTHQIRVHLKYLQRPIVGDYLYAGRKTARDDRQWVPRVMLHAQKIVFHHPVSSDEVIIEAPLPDDMTSVLENIASGL
ncbi:MAG: RluA family pseudouridine synthase, partial [Patescibacteria group bacterium]|nr:RluA family pseudouridine synthase [Patescibacteria group bacterium]